jgi:Ser/Thr protein kinase RdoA (MazF antagonist)
LAARAFEPPEPLLRRRGWLYGPAIMEQLVRHLEGRWRGLEDWWAALRERAAAIGEVHPQHADLTSLVIHGDYYADNLLFDGQRIVALLDYDNAAHQSRIVEVAEALIYFANRPDGRLSVGVYDGVMDLEKVARFVAAYNAVWPLTPAERAALPATAGAIWLTVSLRRLDEQASASREEALARLREAKLLSDWAEAHSAALVDAAG